MLNFYNLSNLEAEVLDLIGQCERLQPASDPTIHQERMILADLSRDEIEDALSILN